MRAHESDDLTWDMGGGAPLGTVMPPSDPNTVKRNGRRARTAPGCSTSLGRDHMLFASLATGYKMGGMYEKFDFCNFGCLRAAHLRSRSM